MQVRRRRLRGQASPASSSGRISRGDGARILVGECGPQSGNGLRASKHCARAQTKLLIQWNDPIPGIAGAATTSLCECLICGAGYLRRERRRRRKCPLCAATAQVTIQQPLLQRAQTHNGHILQAASTRGLTCARDFTCARQDST